MKNLIAARWLTSAVLGCRAIMMADKCLLFDPDTVSSRKFLQAVAPRLQASVGSRAQSARHTHHDPEDADHHFTDDDNRPPFELECLEAAFLVAIGAPLSSLVNHSGTPCIVVQVAATFVLCWHTLLLYRVL